MILPSIVHQEKNFAFSVIFADLHKTSIQIQTLEEPIQYFNWKVPIRNVLDRLRQLNTTQQKFPSLILRRSYPEVDFSVSENSDLVNLDKILTTHKHRFPIFTIDNHYPSSNLSLKDYKRYACIIKLFFKMKIFFTLNQGIHHQKYLDPRFL